MTTPNQPTEKPSAKPNRVDELELDKETVKHLDAPVNEANAIKGASIIDCATRKG